jgi:hypothetical protein
LISIGIGLVSTTFKSSTGGDGLTSTATLPFLLVTLGCLEGGSGLFLTWFC